MRRGACYGEGYFERGEGSLYVNYTWLPDLTIPLAHEIVTQLGIQKTDTILDWGCAKGFLVKSLRLLHYQAWGVDISEYAISQAPEDVRPYVSSASCGGAWLPELFDWVIAKDVLEHIEYDDLSMTLSFLRLKARNVFAIVPLGENGKYVVPEYENDATHVIREGTYWWQRKFIEAGFDVVRASYHMSHIKENWAHHERGNGFFVLRSARDR